MTELAAGIAGRAFRLRTATARYAVASAADPARPQRVRWGGSDKVELRTENEDPFSPFHFNTFNVASIFSTSPLAWSTALVYSPV